MSAHAQNFKGSVATSIQTFAIWQYECISDKIVSFLVKVVSTLLTCSRWVVNQISSTIMNILLCFVYKSVTQHWFKSHWSQDCWSSQAWSQSNLTSRRTDWKVSYSASCCNLKLLLSLLFRAYIDALCEEINDTLQEVGQMMVADLSKNFALPNSFLMQVCIAWMIHSNGSLIPRPSHGFQYFMQKTEKKAWPWCEVKYWCNVASNQLQRYWEGTVLGMVKDHH